MITMSAKKLWVLIVVSGLAAACWCEDAPPNRSKTAADEEQVYKNHRTSKNNDTAQVKNKYPVYPAQVYANLSNARDFTTAKTAEQPVRTTEGPSTDVVRVFITAAPGAANKRTKPDGRATLASAATQQQQQSGSAAAPSVYFVTSKSVLTAESSTPPVHKTPVYSSPSPQANNGFIAATKETADLRASPPTVTADEANRKLKFNNGTKIRRVLKAQQRLKQAALVQQQQPQQQQQQPTVLLSATSTTAAPSPLQSSPHQMQTFVGSSPFVAQQSPANNGPAAYPVTAKVANSSGPSKPFATVLVPKQMLEGNSMMQLPPQDYSSSFRPIAAPVQYASYRPSSVDTNAIAENRRASTEAKPQTGAVKAQTGAVKAQTGAAKTSAGANKAQAAVSSAPKVSKYGFVKQPTYKVEEYVPGDGAAASVVYDKRFDGDGGYKNDRSDQAVFVPANEQSRRDQLFYVPAERREVSEKPARAQHLESAAAQRYDQQLSKAQDQAKPSIKYGFSVPESYGGHEHKKQAHKAAVQPQQQPFREYYPATEVTPAQEAAAAPYPKYDSAGKFDMRPVAVEMAAGPPFVMNSRPPFDFGGRPPFQVDSRPPFEVDSRPPFQVDSRPPFQVDGRPPFEVDSRPPSSGPPKELVGAGPSTTTASRFASHNAGVESSNNVPEVVMGDVNPKDVLKSLLMDMLKGKQLLQSETTSKTSKLSSADDIVDSFFKVSRPNVDLSADNYEIETDMSCNLRSTKYITDGQCVTTKPVVEAVCADRCLVYASSMSPFGVQRQRSSPSVNQQVEALHCVDGDSKLVRVQLHCRDGNTLNNVIKVVTNCRCKLHPIQPQMRSNSPSSHQEMGMPNKDIMDIAAGKF